MGILWNVFFSRLNTSTVIALPVSCCILFPLTLTLFSLTFRGPLYVQGCYDQGFLQSGVLKMRGSYNQRFSRAGVLRSGVLTSRGFLQSGVFTIRGS